MRAAGDQNVAGWWYCVTVECGTSAGIQVGVCVPRPLDSGEDPGFEAWMKRLAREVLLVGEAVLNGEGRDASARELARRLLALNTPGGPRIGSHGGVPAVQAETLDGHRVEIDFEPSASSDWPGERVRREDLDPSPARLVQHGTCGVRAHERRRFRFRAAPARAARA